MKNKKFSNEINELKNIFKLLKGSTLTEIRKFLDKKYERISNRTDKEYDSIYNLAELIQSKTIEKITLKMGKDMIIVIEVIDYPTAPKGFVFFYNEFLNSKMGGIEIYILKEN